MYSVHNLSGNRENESFAASPMVHPCALFKFWSPALKRYINRKITFSKVQKIFFIAPRNYA
jgi:hypothetical protein